ncbi:MAG: hypothetical protein GXO25_02430 [Euryarchaeota archaeon]|nr:hypothetical protein [Euryarchaeota archaeon]
MPGCRARRMFPLRFISVNAYGMVDLLILIGIFAILVYLFFIAMPFIIALALLLLGRYFLRGNMQRRYWR